MAHPPATMGVVALASAYFDETATATPTSCEGVLVVHRDGVRECLDTDCLGVDLRHGPIDAPCDEVFEAACPHCGSLA